MKPGWQPANDVERGLAAALAEGDTRTYARIVTAADLYLPVLPEPGSETYRAVTAALDLNRAYLLAFTSTESLAFSLEHFSRDGHVWEHQETNFATLANSWPDPEMLLALNPGLPIRAVLPVNTVIELAGGNESFVTSDEVEAAAADEVLARIRRACLTELGTGEPPSGARPENELEALLSDAVRQQDSEAFLNALLGAAVVVPTTAQAPESASVHDEDFPWRQVAVGSLRVIPLFSSQGMLLRAARRQRHRVEASFVDVLLGWPGAEYVLCLNPGAETELILPGETVAELVAAIAESFNESSVEHVERPG